MQLLATERQVDEHVGKLREWVDAARLRVRRVARGLLAAQPRVGGHLLARLEDDLRHRGRRVWPVGESGDIVKRARQWPIGYKSRESARQERCPWGARTPARGRW